MKVKIPLTGTKIEHDNGDWEGDMDDIIRPLPFDFGDIGWRVVDWDWENDEAEIELIIEKRGESWYSEWDMDDPRFKTDGYIIPAETEEEFKTRRVAIEQALDTMLKSKTKDDWYTYFDIPRVKKIKS